MSKFSFLVPKEVVRPLRIRDWIPPALVVLIFISIPLFGVTRWPLFDLVGLPVPEFSEAEPMYFVRTDLYRGLSLMFALVPIVLVLWVGKMIGSQMNFFAVILASLFALPQVFDALSIFVRCSELGTIGAAQCPWSSFDDFMYDPWGWIFRGGLMVGVVAWSRMVWKVRKQGAENSPAS